ncbi:MAG: HlyD family secretion protein [Steroidobacterales bacterium]
MDVATDDLKPATTLEDRRRTRLRWSAMTGGVLVVAVVVLLFYLLTGRYVSTDDATLQAAQSSVSTNVPGRVVELDVRENQPVHRGDVLFRLDDRPFRIAVADATAKLDAARLQIRAAEATYRRQLIEATAARNNLTYEQQEYARQQALIASGIASRAQFELAEHALDVARQQYASAQQQADSILALLGGKPGLPPEQHPAMQQAQAALDRANLELSYTVVRAADEGIVAKVEQLQVGDYINAAVPVFTLVSTRDIWVEANFKEDQLSYMRPGQSAEIKLDAYSDHVLNGRVISLSPGTGSTFSALPPENATGNWVKVVQRVPVRLKIESADSRYLQAGLSAEVTVDTEHRRSLSSLFGRGTPKTARPQ